MTLTTRPAQPDDAAAMAEILNEIIRIGGTTAHETPYTPDGIEAHYIAPAHLVACTVAVLDSEVVGFQYLGWPDASYDMPEGWAVIATFAKVGLTGKGIGSALFRATRAAASANGVTHIDATIRADNIGGLAYYEGRGFTDYKLTPAVSLADGTPVDRISKRLTL